MNGLLLSGRAYNQSEMAYGFGFSIFQVTFSEISLEGSGFSVTPGLGPSLFLLVASFQKNISD